MYGNMWFDLHFFIDLLGFVLDKLIGAIVEQISASGLPYSCILTSTAPNVVH